MYRVKYVKTWLDNVAIGSILILISVNNVVADTPQGAVKSDIGNCWVEAGKRYDIDPWLLFSIAQTESSLNPSAINQNANSIDVGLMQINSFWFPPLKEMGINKNDLFEPCLNIHVGAWILAQSIQSFGNTWEAVGAYNAGTGKNEKANKQRKVYAERVYKRFVANAGGMR